MSDIITDKAGKETLDVIAEADQFNKWMFQTIAPFCKGKVLEIGSGLGNISTFFLKSGFEIMLTDLRSEYCNFLRAKFSNHTNLLGVVEIDLVHPDFDNVYCDYFETYDTVFALNVIEHIENDNQALRNCRKLLAKDGHLIILVPAYQKLFNKFDEELGHFRRYTRSSLSNLFIENDLKIMYSKYFNFIGMFGWYFSGNILNKSTIPSSQMQIYNQLVSVWKRIDSLLLNKFGLSTIVVGKK